MVSLGAQADPVAPASAPETGAEATQRASTPELDRDAPFRDLDWVNASGDGRGIYFQLLTHDAILGLPGHPQRWRMSPRHKASLQIACRIPGPTDALGPDPGYTSGVLTAPDHPRQPDAWMWFDPRGWIAHALDFAEQHWTVEVTGPDGSVVEGVLERRRATYEVTRPGVSVRFAPHALIRWLAERTASQRFHIEVKGPDTAMRLAFTSWPGQATALDRMVALCPGVAGRR